MPYVEKHGLTGNACAMNEKLLLEKLLLKVRWRTMIREVAQ